MNITFYFLIAAIMVGVGTWFFFVWAIRSGQFHDIEEPKHKMLENDERS